ncbi:unnamed protein product [Gongylonema pulchrum]|uniref:GRIN_C domain-containing protein n=1 Tax=Gongylonema pulchrum TaxID=637853 RepID=A0A183DV74_9BILA|nr:unnamed protein product [Gongylonema pulchrum]
MDAERLVATEVQSTFSAPKNFFVSLRAVPSRQVSELSKSPSLPTLTCGEDAAITINPSVPGISRRFTVSASSLNDENPRDIARIRSRFKVERVGSLTQKAKKTKSHDCMTVTRSLSESSANVVQEPGFLSEAVLVVKEDKHVVNAPSAQESVVPKGVLDISKDMGSVGVEKDGQKFRFRDAAVRIQDHREKLQISQASQNHRIRQDNSVAEDAGKIVDSVAVLGNTGDDFDSCPNYGESGAFTDPTTCLLPYNHSSSVGVRSHTEVADSLMKEFDLKRDESCAVGEGASSNIWTKGQIAFTGLSVRTEEEGATELEIISEANSATLNREQQRQEVVVEDVAREVVRDIINYVAYEVEKSSNTCSCKMVLLGTSVASVTCSPVCSTTSSLPRSSSNIALSSSEVLETDEEAVHSVVRSLVRDVLLREKEALRRSLRKKRERMVLLPRVNRQSTG